MPDLLLPAKPMASKKFLVGAIEVPDKELALVLAEDSGTPARVEYYFGDYVVRVEDLSCER